MWKIQADRKKIKISQLKVEYSELSITSVQAVDEEAETDTMSEYKNI